MRDKVARIHYDMSMGELHVGHEKQVAPSDLQMGLMSKALECAEEALNEGNPPIGAVLFSPDLDMAWPSHTTDKTTRNVLDHAETSAYRSAASIAGDNLSSFMLVTTLEPCTMCTSVYTQAKIGSITIGASRNDVGALRRRNIGLHEVVSDGQIETTVFRGLFKEQSLALFKRYRQEHGSAKEHGRLFAQQEQTLAEKIIAASKNSTRA